MGERVQQHLTVTAKRRRQQNATFKLISAYKAPQKTQTMGNKGNTSGGERAPTVASHTIVKTQNES
jgi:hypothetical protein